MNTRRLILTALCASIALAAAAPAFADDDWHHGRREWREHERAWREHEWREHHWRGYYGPPVVAAPGYYAPPPVYYPSPGYYR